MDDFTLTSAERALFESLHQHHVRFLIVGLGAAVIEALPSALKTSASGSISPVVTP